MLMPSSPTDTRRSLLSSGIAGLGERLTQFHGVLTGEPVFTGSLATGGQR
jgi:hypothetical protein